EVRIHRQVEHVVCIRDRRHVRRASGLQVLTHGAVIRYEFLNDCPRATRDGLVVLLHAANSFNSTTCRFRGDGVTDENDGAHGREAECESSTDAKTEGT